MFIIVFSELKVFVETTHGQDDAALVRAEFGGEILLYDSNFVAEEESTEAGSKAYVP